MRVTCEKCGGRFEVQKDNRASLCCPTCGTVKRLSAAELAAGQVDEEPEQIDLPAPRGQATQGARPPSEGHDASSESGDSSSEIDLPAPVRRSDKMSILSSKPPSSPSLALPVTPPPSVIDLPAPRAVSGEPSDLPAPKPQSPARLQGFPVIAGPPEPEPAPPALDSLDEPPGDEIELTFGGPEVSFGGDLPGLDDLDDESIDLPAPKGHRGGRSGPLAIIPDDVPDLVAAKRPSGRSGAFPILSTEPPRPALPDLDEDTNSGGRPRPGFTSGMHRPVTGPNAILDELRPAERSRTGGMPVLREPARLASLDEDLGMLDEPLDEPASAPLDPSGFGGRSPSGGHRPIDAAAGRSPSGPQAILDPAGSGLRPPTGPQGQIDLAKGRSPSGPQGQISLIDPRKRTPSGRYDLIDPNRPPSGAFGIIDPRPGRTPSGRYDLIDPVRPRTPSGGHVPIDAEARPTPPPPPPSKGGAGGSFGMIPVEDDSIAIDIEDVAERRAPPPPPPKPEEPPGDALRPVDPVALLSDGPAVAGDAAESGESALERLQRARERKARQREVKPLRVLMLVGGVMGALLAIGLGLNAFADLGKLLGLERHKVVSTDDVVKRARELLRDDTVPAYRHTIAVLRDSADADPSARTPRALEAQAQLSLALLGSASSVKPALARLNELQGAPPTDLDVQKARALRLLLEGKAADAATQLQSVADTAPTDAQAFVYLGWAQLAAGEPGKAASDFQKALAIDGQHVGAKYGLGRARELSGDGKSALDFYQKTLALRPEHFRAAVGVERLGKGSPTESDKKVRELLEKNGADAGMHELAEALSLVAQRSFQAGRYGDAEDRYKRAVQLNPDLSLAEVGLARTLCAEQRSAEAVTLLQQVLKSEPRNVEAHLLLARASLDARKTSEATNSLADAEKLSARKPDPTVTAQIAYLRGRVLEAEGDSSPAGQAMTAYRAAIAADPLGLDAYFAVSRLLAKGGKTAEARQTLEQAEAQASSDPQLQDSLGAAYLATADLGKAEKAFREVILRAPELTTAQLHLGETLEREDKLDEAGAIYEALEKAHADLPGLAEQEARLSARKGKLDEAVTHYAQALLQPRPSPSLRAEAADAFLKAGKLEESRSQFELAVKDDERSASGHLGMARVALAEGRAEDAEPQARRAVSLEDTPPAHLVYGRVLETLLRLPQAKEEYQRARGGEGETAFEARLGIARILVRDGAVKDALVETQALVKSDPRRAEPYVLMGDCFDELSHRDKARAAYLLAVQKDPGNAEGAFKLGRIEADQGRGKQAAELLDGALKAGAGKLAFAAEAYLLDGNLHKNLGENAAAAAAYKKFLEVAPADAPERGSVKKSLDALSPGHPEP